MHNPALERRWMLDLFRRWLKSGWSPMSATVRRCYFVPFTPMPYFSCRIYGVALFMLCYIFHNFAGAKSRCTTEVEALPADLHWHNFQGSSLVVVVDKKSPSRERRRRSSIRFGRTHGSVSRVK